MQCISAFFQRGQQLKMLKLSSEGLRIQMDKGEGGQGFVDSSRARCFLFSFQWRPISVERSR